MKTSTQLNKWLKGESIHNDEYNCCCPDLSCCGGELAPKHEREAFIAALYAGNSRLVGILVEGFLSRTIIDTPCIGQV